MLKGKGCDYLENRDLWERAGELSIQTSADIVEGFSVGFDRQIPEETKNALIRFIYWVEDHYSMPVTLWVDFKYRHYLRNRQKKRVGYLFYWADFQNYPVFDNYDDIPVIELPVRTERWTIQEILTSFIEAICCYYTWLFREPLDAYQPDRELVEAILQKYLQDTQ